MTINPTPEQIAAAKALTVVLYKELAEDIGADDILPIARFLAQRDAKRDAEVRVELKKAEGIIKCLLTHTIHSGSLHRPGCNRKVCCGYQPNEKSDTYRLYTRRKKAAMDWLSRRAKSARGSK